MYAACDAHGSSVRDSHRIVKRSAARARADRAWAATGAAIGNVIGQQGGAYVDFRCCVSSLRDETREAE